MDFGSFIIGTAVVWGVIYLLVNPLAKVLAIARLKSISGQTSHGSMDTNSIPERYYMFMGSLIFAIIGLAIGVATGTFFIGLSWKKKDLPGMATFILSSVAGSFINIGFNFAASGTMLALAAMLIAATGIAVATQSANVLKWKMGAPVVTPQPPVVAPNIPVTTPMYTGFSSTASPSVTYPNVAVGNTFAGVSKFCGQCGAEHKSNARFCGECGAKIA
jgi:hypothetical protein